MGRENEKCDFSLLSSYFSLLPSVTDRVGFEPTRLLHPHEFQSCSLNRSDTCPKQEMRETGNKGNRRVEAEHYDVLASILLFPSSPVSLVSLKGTQTGRDSNSRYRCRYDGFRDRCLQPLGHLSIRRFFAARNILTNSARRVSIQSLAHARSRKECQS